MQTRARCTPSDALLVRAARLFAFALGCLALPVSAAPKRLLLQGDDWVCAYAPFRTHHADRLLVDACGIARELYDWQDGFVALPADVRDLSPDGRWAAGSDARFDDTQVFLYDLLPPGGANRVTTTELGQPSTGRNSGAVVTADGTHVLFTSFALDLLPAGSGGVAVLEWRRSDGALTLRAASAHLLGASADGDVLVTYNTSLLEPHFAVHDRSTGARETHCVAGASVCEFLGLSPDGRWLAYAHAAAGQPSGRVLRDRTTGQEWELAGFERGRGSVAFDAQSQRVAYDAPTAADPATHGLRVRDLPDGVEQAVFFDRPLSWFVAPAAFGPDRLLAVYDGTTVIVSLDTIFAQGFD
jgi:Tol biopolymer transport system component